MGRHSWWHWVVNLLWFKAMWLSCVMANNLALVWVVPMLGVHLSLCRRRGRELALIVCCTGLGLLVEWLFLQGGILQFPQPGALAGWPDAWPPPWMVLLWAAFATTLGHSLSWFQNHPGWAVLMGVVGGAFSYLGGSRLADVVIAPPMEASLAAIGLAWGLLMPLLAWLSRRLGV